MTAEASALLVAIVIPLVALAAAVGLVGGIHELERSRDELIELDAVRR